VRVTGVDGKNSLLAMLSEKVVEVLVVGAVVVGLEQDVVVTRGKGAAHVVGFDDEVAVCRAQTPHNDLYQEHEFFSSSLSDAAVGPCWGKKWSSIVA